MPAGRPSDYSEETAAEICLRIANGQSIREIARADDMPAMGTIFAWLAKHPSFQERYARAKEVQAEHLAEEILDIADDATNDWMQRAGEDENEYWQLNGENIQRSRVRIDARKWLLSKLLPKKYGDRVTQEHVGQDGGPIKVEKIERVVVDPKA